MNVKRRCKDFVRIWYVLGMYPSYLFSIVVWQSCHVFRNVRSFNEGHENIYECADDRSMYRY